MGTLQLVRHGQASAHEENYDKLSPLGELQARLLGESWKRRGLAVDRVVCGPLVRQRRTAEIAAAAAGLPAPSVIDALEEMRIEPLFKAHLPALFARHAHLQTLGDASLAAEGVAERSRKVAQLFEQVLLLWGRGQARGDGVEPWLEFRARVRRVLRSFCEDARGQRLLAFTSAGVVAAAVQLALDTSDVAAISLAFQVRNSSVSQFLFSADRFSLVAFNEVPHLEDPGQITLR